MAFEGLRRGSANGSTQKGLSHVTAQVHPDMLMEMKCEAGCLRVQRLPKHSSYTENIGESKQHERCIHLLRFALMEALEKYSNLPMTAYGTAHSMPQCLHQQCARHPTTLSLSVSHHASSQQRSYQACTSTARDSTRNRRCEQRAVCFTKRAAL